MKKRMIKVIFIVLIVIVMIISILSAIFNVTLTNFMFSGISKNYEVSASSGAKEIVNDMGLGWNFGGQFAVTSDSLYSYMYKGSYQAQISYQSNPYTQWDADSSCPLFDSQTGKLSLSWEMTSLNSTGNVGTFSLQIINQNIPDSGNTKLKYKIENTKITLADNTEIDIGGEGTISSKMQTSTETYQIDLTSVTGIQDTSDLIGATVSMDISIIDYAVPVSSNVLATVDPVVFDAVKAAGFNTVRLPVTFVDYMDSEGNIDADYLAQVQTVVDYIIDRGMYCTLDVHHDAGNLGWLSVGYIDEHKTKFQNMWTQIATKFADYDYHLIFEGANEPLNFLQSNMWDVYDVNSVLPESIENVNKLNQYFVDAVRAVEGNEDRFLMVSSYANKEASYYYTYANNTKFTLPTDTATDKLIVDVHIYVDNSSDIDWRLNMLESTGYAVYIGEFGLYKDSITSTSIESQVYLVESAATKGMQCAIWDDGGSMAVLNTGALTSENYNSSDVWYGSNLNYIPSLLRASGNALPGTEEGEGNTTTNNTVTNNTTGNTTTNNTVTNSITGNTTTNNTVTNSTTGNTTTNNTVTNSTTENTTTNNTVTNSTTGNTTTNNTVTNNTTENTTTNNTITNNTVTNNTTENTITNNTVTNNTTENITTNNTVTNSTTENTITNNTVTNDTTGNTTNNNTDNAIENNVHENVSNQIISVNDTDKSSNGLPYTGNGTKYIVIVLVAIAIVIVSFYNVNKYGDIK